MRVDRRAGKGGRAVMDCVRSLPIDRHDDISDHRHVYTKAREPI